ncbi:MAG: phospholipid carrier-dependent glycosyltransferase, partial [Chlorobiaceae bacterium]|nr:phospholipid carrier-dependent glycosyltransferase [Chlorobiaceae bacterium]
MRRETGNRTAFFAAALMALSLQVVVISKAAIADALLNCFVTVTMLSLLRHYLTGSKNYLLAAFTASGFGMLTKGPIAMLIPAAVTFLFYLQQRKFREWLALILNPSGIAVFLLISMPWYLLEYQDQGDAFIQGFFLKHNINRFNTSFETHSGSIFYYFPVLLLGMMPFTGLIFSLAFRLKSMLGDPGNRFLLTWFSFVFAFFSLSGTKLPHYIIYGYTPLFILMAKVFPKVTHPWRTALWPVLALLVLTSLPLLLPEAIDRAGSGYVTFALEAAREITGKPYMLVMAGTALLVAAIPFLPRLSPEGKAIATGTVFTLLINLYLFPLAGRLLQEPVKEAALLARREGYKTVMWKAYYPSFLVYSQSFVEKRDPRAGDIVLTTADKLEKAGLPATALYSRYGIVLAKIRNSSN